MRTKSSFVLWPGLALTLGVSAGQLAAASPKAPVSGAQVRAALTLSSTTTAAPLLTANYYGLHLLHLDTVTPWPSIPFGTWRLWDSHVAWVNLQPTASTWDWQTLDTYVALAQEKKADVLLELGQSPAWASARPTENDPYGMGASAEPSSNTLWTNYVTAVATRYKGRIAYYEIWNEANTTDYTGSVAELTQLTALAAKAIKAVDPAAKIISPSISGVNTANLAFLEKLFQAGIGSSIDVVGAHFYELGRAPEAMLPDVASVQALMSKYNLSGKPLFNTETGWASPTNFNSVDDQSAWMMRTLLVGWGAGLQRFMWYAWDNSNWITLTMTQSNFKTPTMVATAYQVLQNWTVGKEVSRCAVTGTGSTVWSCDITDLSGDHSRIYWSTSSTVNVTPSLTWHPLHTQDMYGNVKSYTGGAISVTTHPLLISE